MNSKLGDKGLEILLANAPKNVEELNLGIVICNLVFNEISSVGWRCFLTIPKNNLNNVKSLHLSIN